MNKTAEKFFNAVDAKNQCPVCSNNEGWLYLEDLEEAEGMLPIGQAGQKEREWINPPRFLPVMYVICDNCGFVRTHAIFKISEWQKKSMVKDRHE